MAVVKGSIPISDRASIAFTNDADSLFLVVGKWFVEVANGKLIVRADNRAANTLESSDVVLKVDV